MNTCFLCRAAPMNHCMHQSFRCVLPLHARQLRSSLWLRMHQRSLLRACSSNDACMHACMLIATVKWNLNCMQQRAACTVPCRGVCTLQRAVAAAAKDFEMCERVGVHMRLPIDLMTIDCTQQTHKTLQCSVVNPRSKKGTGTETNNSLQPSTHGVRTPSAE